MLLSCCGGYADAAAAMLRRRGGYAAAMRRLRGGNLTMWRGLAVVHRGAWLLLCGAACARRRRLAGVGAVLHKIRACARAAMVQEAPLKIYARGVARIIFYFFRGPRARAS
jgi:hypothetical protein